MSGEIAAGGVTFHDYPPPSGTTQMEVVVQWTDPDIPLRLVVIDPNCNPAARDDCHRFTDPIGPLSGSAGTSIRTIATNQGPTAGPRMRFMILNLSERGTTYTMTIAPRRAGCT